MEQGALTGPTLQDHSRTLGDHTLHGAGGSAALSRGAHSLIRLIPMLSLLGVLATIVAPVSAQVHVLEPEKRFETFQTQQFQSITQGGAAVGFLPGSLDRAHHVLARLDNLATYFKRWQPKLAVPMIAYAVDRARWKEIGLPGLYGLPLRTSPSAVFVPATGDSEVVRMWRSALGVSTLPMVPGVPVTGTPEEAASLALADVLMQVEAARGFAVGAKLQGNDDWIQEVVAHVAALIAFRQTEPLRAAELNDLFTRLRDRMGGQHRFDAEHFSQSLLQGDESQVRAWLWYQGVFFAAAEAIVEKDGKRAIARMLKLRKAHGRMLGSAALLKRYPELRAWRSRWFKPATGEAGLSTASVGAF